MRSCSLVLFIVILLLTSCSKEPAQLNAVLHAKCRYCAIAYAGGPNHSTFDTIIGVFDSGVGDTVAVEHQWNVTVKEGDNLFLRACRIRLDTAFGNLEVRVGGDVRPMTVVVDTFSTCAQINTTAKRP